jgi:hypothetical protein
VPEILRLDGETDIQYAQRVLHAHSAKNLSGPIEMVEDKPCKGSVRYSAKDERSPVQSIYVSRDWKNPMPKNITLEIK